MRFLRRRTNSPSSASSSARVAWRQVGRQGAQAGLSCVKAEEPQQGRTAHPPLRDGGAPGKEHVGQALAQGAATRGKGQGEGRGCRVSWHPARCTAAGTASRSRQEACLRVPASRTAASSAAVLGPGPMPRAAAGGADGRGRHVSSGRASRMLGHRARLAAFPAQRILTRGRHQRGGAPDRQHATPEPRLAGGQARGRHAVAKQRGRLHALRRGLQARQARRLVRRQRRTGRRRLADGCAQREDGLVAAAGVPPEWQRAEGSGRGRWQGSARLPPHQPPCHAGTTPACGTAPAPQLATAPPGGPHVDRTAAVQHLHALCLALARHCVTGQSRSSSGLSVGTIGRLAMPSCRPTARPAGSPRGAPGSCA